MGRMWMARPSCRDLFLFWGLWINFGYSSIHCKTSVDKSKELDKPWPPMAPPRRLSDLNAFAKVGYLSLAQANSIVVFPQVGNVAAAREVFNDLQSAPARVQTMVWNTMLKAAAYLFASVCSHQPVKLPICRVAILEELHD